ICRRMLLVVALVCVVDPGTLSLKATQSALDPAAPISRATQRILWRIALERKLAVTTLVLWACECSEIITFPLNVEQQAILLSWYNDWLPILFRTNFGKRALAIF